MISGFITHKHHHKDLESNKSSLPPYKITISKAKLKHGIINLTGVAESKKKIALVAEATGQIEKIYVKSGDFLHAGDVVLSIEVNNKKELYERAKEKFIQSEIKFKSTSMLYQKKLVADVDFAEAKANLASAEADFKQAEIDYKNTKVMAPFDGYIGEINVNERDYVMNGIGSMPTTVALFIAAEPMVIKSEIAENKISSIKPNLKAFITTISGKEIEGRVLFADKIINQQTNSFPLEIAFDNANFAILHGQAVSIKILLDQELAHSLPQSVLVLNEEGKVGIKALDEQNKVRFYPIKIVDEEADKIWLTGLPTELRVITLGHVYINVGDELKIDQETTVQ